MKLYLHVLSTNSCSFNFLIEYIIIENNFTNLFYCNFEFFQGNESNLNI